MLARRFAALGLLAALLSGCSGGDARPSLNLEIIQELRAAASARMNPAPPQAELTRALLDTLDGSFMEAFVERTDQLAYLFVSAAWAEPKGYTLIVWRSEDNATLALRNDVLISTKGIGGDLLSSKVPTDPSVVGPAGSGERRMSFLTGDNHSRTITFACEIADAGPQTITIVERKHRTRLLQEHCSGEAGEITNQYWIDAGSGIAWQSRQWAGPEIGYIRFRRLTSG